MSLRSRIFGLISLVLLAPAWADVQPLRLHLADNHAESFRWFANALELDDRTQMVLIDHHSDASCVVRSDDVREQLRRVGSAAERQERCLAWRANGDIQAYNWIEALMPRPIEHVTWIPALKLDERSAAEHREEAVDAIDGRLEFELRSGGTLARAWEVKDFSSWEKAIPRRVPTVVAVDLDFFLGVPREQWQTVWHELWGRILKEPMLLSVSCSISRPWQRSEADVQALLRLVLWSYSRTFPVSVTIDAELDEFPDDSLEAKKWREEGKPIPRWDAAELPTDLRGLVAQHRDSWTFFDRKRDWKKILAQWHQDLAPIGFAFPQADANGVIRMTEDEEVLRLDVPDHASDGAIRWYAVEPMHKAVDLLSETMLGKSFSAEPASFASDVLRFVEETPDAVLDLTKHCRAPGRYRWVAEIPVKGGGWQRSSIADVRRTVGVGFKGALSEILRQPYIFGIGLLPDGAESGWGSDCSNLLVYAWRRNGVRMKWGDSSMVAAQLQFHDHQQTLTAAAIADGIAVSFGKHMAALWEDRAPLGTIGAEDMVIHHLGGFPEVVPLADVMKGRGAFKIYRLPEEEGVDIGFVGDVVMKEAIPADMTRLSAALAGFQASFGNLEGLAAEADGNAELDLRFGPRSLEQLRSLAAQSFTAFSVANNHAADGKVPIAEPLKRLRSAGIPTFGDTLKPYHWEKNGVRLAIFGVCVIHSDGDVIKWNEHASKLCDAITKERQQGRHCIIMTHWGREYQKVPDAEQQAVASRLLRSGAVAVIGCHSHIDQPLAWHHGGIVAYSLGNALYPEKWQSLDSGSVLALRIYPSGRVAMLRRNSL